MPEISLEYIGRRLDDLQGEATNNRLVADVVLKQMRLLQADLDAQRSQLDLIDYRLGSLEDRLGKRFDAIDAKLDQLLARETTHG